MLALAAGVAYAEGTFKFNREGWRFDKKLSQKCAYQSQEMQIRQFELYREDIRDLVDLTVGKMDNYLVVNTLQLGFSVTLFVEGRHEPGTVTPAWLTMLFTLSNACAMLFYAQSVWLAMHASISAHAMGVETLTQFVRLPVPTDGEIDSARAHAQEFEGENLVQMFRMPILRQQMKKLQTETSKYVESETSAIAAGDDAASASSELPHATAASAPTLPTAASSAARLPRSAVSAPRMPSNEPPTATFATGTFVPGTADAAAVAAAAGDTNAGENGGRRDVKQLEHIKYFREKSRKWQAFDAYARVCMTIGALMTLHALSYYSLGRLAEVPQREVMVRYPKWPAQVMSVLLFSTASWVLMYLDLFLSRRHLWITCILAACPPTVTMIAQCSEALHWSKYRQIIYVVYILHTCLTLLTLKLASGRMVRGVALPTMFRSVLYLDIFGTKRDEDDENAGANDPDDVKEAAVLPWYSVRAGCLVCMLAWAIGLGWCIVEDSPRHDHDGKPFPWLVGHMALDQVVTSGPGPHPFFHADHIACHEDFGPWAVLAGRYTAHVVPLDGKTASASGPTMAMGDALSTCLARVPGFLGRGLESISLDCQPMDGPVNRSRELPATSCALLILVRGSNQAAWCPLTAAGKDGAERTPHPRLARVMGEEWSYLLTAADVHEPTAAMGLGPSGLVKLRLMPSSSDDLQERFMPEYVMPLPGASEKLGAPSLSVVPGRAVLSLRAGGQVDVLPLTGAERSFRTHVQAADDSQQDGDAAALQRLVSSCVRGQDLLVLEGSGQPSGKDSRIRKYRLPVQLTNSVERIE